VWGSGRALCLADALKFAGRSAGPQAVTVTVTGRLQVSSASTVTAPRPAAAAAADSDAGPTDASDLDSDGQ
jgi:hypothetical protein